MLAALLGGGCGLELLLVRPHFRYPRFGVAGTVVTWCVALHHVSFKLLPLTYPEGLPRSRYGAVRDIVHEDYCRFAVTHP